MLKEALAIYIKWLLCLIAVCAICYFFELSILVILGGIGCLVVPANRARIYLIKKHPNLLCKKQAWTLISTMLLAPFLFGLWYAFRVKPSPDLHRANIVVVWLLFFFIFPLCIYSYWFFNKSSWEKARSKVTVK